MGYVQFFVDDEKTKKLSKIIIDSKHKTKQKFFEEVVDKIINGEWKI